MTTQSLLYLWPERTLFIGGLDEPLHLTQGASTLSLSLGGRMQIQEKKSGITHESTSVLIPAGCPVDIDSRQNVIVNLNLDVLGEDYFHLKQSMQRHAGELSFELNNETEYREVFGDIYQFAYQNKETRSKLHNLLSWRSQPPYTFEARVLKAVRIIQDTIDTNLSIEDLAEQVNLSVSGLTKLFKKQTGVPIRRYRQWHRLYVTACEIGKGQSLTDAALTAGFVDLSHCTNTFTQIFGIKPSYFLLRPKAIKILTEHSSNLNCKRKIATAIDTRRLAETE